MVDFGTILFTAGVSLVQKLLFGWISEGKVAVRVATVERQIAVEARAEAERLRVRVDDLEKATRQALHELMASSPQLTFATSGLRHNLRLDFDPKDPNSSKTLLVALKQRMDQLVADAGTQAPPQDPSLPPGASMASAGTIALPAGNHHAPDSGNTGRARRMLDDLQARVGEREAERE